MTAVVRRGDVVEDRIGNPGLVIALGPSPVPYEPGVALVSFDDYPTEPAWCDLDGLRLVAPVSP